MGACHRPGAGMSRAVGAFPRGPGIVHRHTGGAHRRVLGRSGARSTDGPEPGRDPPVAVAARPSRRPTPIGAGQSSWPSSGRNGPRGRMPRPSCSDGRGTCRTPGVVTVPKSSTDPSILLGRFADALGVDVSKWDRSAPANESLDAVQAELLRQLNRVTAASLDRRAQRRLINAVLLPYLSRTRTGRRLRLPTVAAEPRGALGRVRGYLARPGVGGLVIRRFGAFGQRA